VRELVADVMVWALATPGVRTSTRGGRRGNEVCHILDLPSFPALPSTHLPPVWVVHPSEATS